MEGRIAAAAKPAIIKVAAICGSLRKNSRNRGILRSAIQLSKDSIEGMQIDYVDIEPLPFINTDLVVNGIYPPVVEAFRRKILEADSILFASPHDYSVSGFAITTMWHWSAVLMYKHPKKDSMSIYRVHINDLTGLVSPRPPPFPKSIGFQDLPCRVWMHHAVLCRPSCTLTMDRYLLSGIGLELANAWGFGSLHTQWAYDLDADWLHHATYMLDELSQLSLAQGPYSYPGGRLLGVSTPGQGFEYPWW